MLPQEKMSFLLRMSRNYGRSTYSSVASAWVTPSRRAPSLSARLPPSHPAICHTGRSALSLWMDSAPPPVQKHIQQMFLTGNYWRACVFTFTFSQYQPALTPSLLWPMVTLLRGLRSAAISMLKMSVRPRSNFPPAKNTWMEHMKT